MSDTPPFDQRLETAVSSVEADAALFNAIVNGPQTGPTSVVQVESGPCLTLRAAVAQITGTAISGLLDGLGSTLGDMTYRGSSAWLSLAGNTAANMAVLTQTGNGLVSSAPAWVGTTGTGNIVRATSPVLVTPNLGTPSAAVLTNATGLPLNTGITGTLGVTNGGSGLSSAVLGDLRYGSGTNVISALAGNVAVTMAVLTQTGNGTVSAAPAWTSTTGTGNVVRAISPTFTTPILGAATATSITGATATDLTLQGGNSGVSLVLGQGTALSTLTSTGVNQWLLLNNTAASNGYVFRTARQGTTLGIYHTTAAAGLGTVSNHPLDFFTFDGSTALRLTATGNLLIGTTTDMSGSGGLKVAGTTASTSTTTGSGIFGGGIGVAGAINVGGTITSGSYHDVSGGIGTPVAGHAQYGGSGSYGASIIGNGSAYDFGLFNKNGTDVMHVATGGTTVAFSGNVSADGQSGYIGQATTSSRYFDVGSTTNNTKVGYNLGVYDGFNNFRSSLFLDDATGITGINLSYSSGTPKFQVQYAGVSMMELSSTASTFSGTGTHLFSGSLGLAYAGTQKWHMTADASNNLVFTRSGVADRMTLSSGGNLTVTGDINAGSNIVFAAPPAAGTRYLLSGTNGYGTGKLIIQAGGGSSAWGGTLNLYEAAHATRGGWATVGLGVTGAKFTINSGGFADGADVFTVDKSGTVNVTSTTSASSSTTGALTIGNGTAATNVAIGGGNVNAGGTLTVGANIEMIGGANLRFTGAGGGLFYTSGYSQPISIQASALNLNTLSGGVTTIGGTTSGTSTTAAAILGKSMGLTENLFVGGQLTVNNLLSFFGATTGSTFIREDSIGFGYNTNGSFDGYINYSGYQGGATQFRNLTIGDGKNATVAVFTGSTKAATFNGVTVLKNYTVATLPSAASYTYGEAYVSDATQAAGTSLGSAPTGGGSVVRGVYSNGSAWLLR